VPAKRPDAETEYENRCDSSDDPIVHLLGACLREIGALPDEMSRGCANHVASALEAYLAQVGSTLAIAAPARGGLAPWQLHRAKEFLSSRLDETVSGAELARECDLSPSHFSRAFKQTTGKPPHRWMLELRVEKAKEMLLGSALSLAEIAVACGFADQSHFTRVFSRSTKSSPGKWRRLWRSSRAVKPSRFVWAGGVGHDTISGEHSCR
jgi:transcriptional regulator GlxA family with amidase domain